MENTPPPHGFRPYELFIGGLSLFSLFILVGLATSGSSVELHRVLQFADTGIAVVFLGDFIGRLVRAEDKWRYMRTWGWLDLLSSIPTVSALRVGRLARLARLFRVARGIKAARVLTEVHQRRGESAAMAALLVTVLLTTLASASVLYFEDAPGSNIKTAEDAIWWAFATITTVGYGDRYPVTTEGRVVAVFLMLAGVGLFGVLSGLLASWFLRSPGQREH